MRSLLGILMSGQNILMQIEMWMVTATLLKMIQMEIWILLGTGIKATLVMPVAKNVTLLGLYPDTLWETQLKHVKLVCLAEKNFKAEKCSGYQMGIIGSW